MYYICSIDLLNATHVLLFIFFCLFIFGGNCEQLVIGEPELIHHRLRVVGTLVVVGGIPDSGESRVQSDLLVVETANSTI